MCIIHFTPINWLTTACGDDQDEND
jgi:hypothetical protein